LTGAAAFEAQCRQRRGQNRLSVGIPHQACIMLTSNLIRLVAVVLLTATAHAGSIEDTFIYKTVGQRKLRIDWTRPADWKATDRRAAVAFIHGGAWVGGAPGQFAPHSIELAERGVVCFRIEYRLLDRQSLAPPLTCTADVSDAIRYIRGHADQFGVDPNRIAAGGGSAGGHLAAYLGMMDDEQVDSVSRKPNALCLFNPVYDNGPGEWGTKRVGDEYPKYSPAHNISADDPPAIVFLGTMDKLVPVSTAERFRDHMLRAGVRSELCLYLDQPHGFFNQGKADSIYYRLTVTGMMAFLDSLGWFQ
jgi:acetyl esterase/lipase